MRKLKYHEKKLLKKVDFFCYRKENSLREIKVQRRFHLQNREDYVKNNKLVGAIRKICCTY
jgi:U3 small nucleolar ribonucleoprotein protein IMP3